jgi:hypothetical protein
VFIGVEGPMEDAIFGPNPPLHKTLKKYLENPFNPNKKLLPQK